jgi:hypothetical protein
MATSRSIAIARASVGLAQGIALYLLYRAAETKGWPTTAPHICAALQAVVVFIPVVVVAGLGNLRSRTLAAWAIVAAACCAGLAVYDIFREPLAGGRSGLFWMTLSLWLSLGSVLFIVHSLIVAGAADRRLVASYARYSDVAWKHGVQLALAASFVGALWLLLFLSAELFRMIGIRALTDLIHHPWFAAPATMVALTYAIHATDARADLVRGVRTLALTLLSWLLPMMVAIAVAFLAALPFAGLQLLWNMRSATTTLLQTSAVLVFLVNAAYQDGQGGDSAFRLVRSARSLAAFVLVPLVGLAAYGLTLRAQQHGWTPPRIIAGACVVVAGCYAVGYAIAALRPNLALKGLEPTNIVTAYVIVAVVLCLFSPIADPSRIAVADQLRRLESGKETPATFDFKFLRFGSGRYGKTALERLAQAGEGPNAAAISEQAKRVILMAKPWDDGPRPSASQRAENITVVHPRGQALPDSFLQQVWTKEQERQLPRAMDQCLFTVGASCQAVLLDLDGDGSMEILLFSHLYGRAGSLYAGAFKAGPDGSWTWLGPIANSDCAPVLDALETGQFRAVEPLLKDIDANGIRLRVFSVFSVRGCVQ